MDTSPSPEASDSSFIKRLLNIIGLAKSPDTAEDLEQEIQDLLEDGEEHGLISAQEGMMINSIFELRDTLAREIMTPRTEMICAPATATITEIISLITENGFTRIPVYTDTLDNITGILHAKDLLLHSVLNEPQTRACDISNPALFIMEKKVLMPALNNEKIRIHWDSAVTDIKGDQKMQQVILKNLNH